MSEGPPASVRRFFTEGAVYAAGSVAGQLAPILLVPVYARTLAPADVGFFAILLSLVTLALPLAVLGLDSAAARSYWRTPEGPERDRLLRTWFWTQASLSIGLAALLALASPLVAQAFGRPGEWTAVALAAGVLPLRIAATFLNQGFRIRRRPWQALAFNATLAGGTVLATLVALLQLGLGVAGLIGGQLVGLAAAVLLWLPRLRPVARPQVAWPLLRRLLAYGLPLVPAGLLAWTGAYADRWILARWAGLDAAGTYQVAVYAAMLVGLPVAAFGQALGPFAVHTEGRPEAPQALRRIALLATLGLSALALLVAVWAGDLLAVVAGAGYGDGAVPLGLLAFAHVFAAFTLLGGLQCNLGEDNRPYLGTFAVTTALALASALVLVPRIGLLGAAVASLAAQAAGAAVLLAWSRRVHDLAYPLPAMVATVLGFGLLALGATLARDSAGPRVAQAAATLLGLALAGALLAGTRRRALAVPA